MKLSYTALSLITLLNITQPSISVAKELYEVLGTISDAVEPQLVQGDAIRVIKEEASCLHSLKRDLPLINCNSSEIIETKHFLSGPEDRFAMVYVIKNNPTKYHLTIGERHFDLDEEIIPIDFYFGRIGEVRGPSWLMAKIGNSCATLNYDSRVSGWVQLGTITDKNEFCLTPTHAYVDFNPVILVWYLKQLELASLPYERPCQDTKKTNIRPISYNNKHNILVTTTFTTDLVRSVVQIGRPEDACFTQLYDHKEVINYLASNGDIVCAAGATKLTIADISSGDILQTIEGSYKDLDISQDGSFIAARDEDNNAVIVWQKKD